MRGRFRLVQSLGVVVGLMVFVAAGTAVQAAKAKKDKGAAKVNASKASIAKASYGTVDGKPVEGTWRSHQVLLSGLGTRPDHLRMLEEWMRSYRAEELFDADGTLLPELQALAPSGTLVTSEPYSCPCDTVPESRVRSP